MKTLHARVHDIRQRITQQEVVIELRVPIEIFSEVVQHLHDSDVLILRREDTEVGEEPYGFVSDGQ